MIVLAVVLAFVLQYHWMKSVKSEAGAQITSNSFAEKAANWMLKKRGIQPETPSGRWHNPEVQQVMCTTCDGLGTAYDDDGRRSPCPICQGVGYRSIRPFDASDRICPACGGMGRVFDGEGERVGAKAQSCPRCDGRGFIQSGVSEESTDAVDAASGEE